MIRAIPALVLLLAGCTGKTPAEDTDLAPNTTTDSGATADSGVTTDSGVNDDTAATDSGATDSGATADSGADDTSTADTATVLDTATMLDTAVTTPPTDDDLYGNYPTKPVSVPTFAATNYDDTPRSRDDLEGHYTIMWFYPLAATAG